jgi:hypothetical protein
MNQADFYRILNPVMLTKQEIQQLKDLLNQVKKENR